MKDTFDDISDYVDDKSEDGAKKFHYLAMLVEEVGELSRSMLTDKGLKSERDNTESAMQECADVVNSAVALYIKLGGDYEQLIKQLEKKID